MSLKLIIKKMGIKRWYILLITFLVTNIVFGQEIKLEQAISDLIQKYGGVGVSVAVVKDNSIVYTHAFGYKNREDSVPLQINDMFRIASVSKVFVATAIMQLVEKGCLSLDDDVNKFLDFKVENPKYIGKAITIGMLLYHRSSVNDSQGRNSFDVINPMLNPNYKKCYSEFEPGSAFVYCNLNYNILGAIIEKIAHKKIDKYIMENITNPLKIKGGFNGLKLDSSLFTNSYWYNKQKDLFVLKNKSIYQPDKKHLKNYKLGYSTPVFSPFAGMIISPKELTKFMLMHINNGCYGRKQIISAESEYLMRTVPMQSNGYALSFLHYKDLIKGEELIGQTGGDEGTHTAMIFHPDSKYGFVVFCNGCKSKSIDGHELNFEIIRSLYKYLVKFK